MAIDITASLISQRLSHPNKDASELLPELLKRLIESLCGSDNIKHIRFPGINATHLHGLDGKLSVDDSFESQFIPSGLSAWEVGTNKDALDKVRDDFNAAPDKAKLAFSCSSIEDITFVFVTSQMWNSAKWRAEASSKSEFKNILVIDAVDIESWLKQCPEVAAWLSHQCGWPTKGFYSAESYLNKQEIVLGVNSVEKLVVAGRDDNLKELHSLIDNNSDHIYVYGESIEESAAFTAAAFTSEEFKGVPPLFLVEANADIDNLHEFANGMHIMPLDPAIADEIELRLRPEWNCKLIKPKPRISGNPPQGLNLKALDSNSLREILQEQYRYSSDRAHKIASECFGSYAVVCRLLSNKIDGKGKWTEQSDKNVHASLVLLGQWNFEHSGDIEVVEQLSGMGRREIDSKISECVIPHGIWVRDRGLVRCTPMQPLWRDIPQFLTPLLLNEYAEIAYEILSSDMLVSGAGCDKQNHRNYSEQLKRGVADAVVRLSLVDNEKKQITQRIIRRLFDGREEDLLIRWEHLHATYSRLAEAWPKQYLDELERVIQLKDDNGKALFHSSDVYESMLMEILYALQRLAWHKDLFFRVISVLAKLSVLHPDGYGLSNPVDSLIGILLPWHPGSCVAASEAIGALELIHGVSAELAWGVAVELLPHRSRIIIPTSKPEHLELEDDDGVTYAYYYECLEGIVRKLTVWCRGCDKFIGLLRAYPDICRAPIGISGLLKGRLKAEKPDEYSEMEKGRIADVIREIYVNHKEFADAKWAMPPEEINYFESLLALFAPSDLIDKYKYMFTGFPSIPNQPMQRRGDGWDDWVKSQQVYAVEEIYAEGGLSSIFILAKAAEWPDIVGRAFAECEQDDDTLYRVIQHTLSGVPQRLDSDPITVFGGRYIYEMCQRKQWRIKIANLLGDANLLSAEQKANILLAINATKDIWNIAESLDAKIQAMYWKNFWVGIPEDEHFSYVIGKMRNYGRHVARIMMISDKVRYGWPTSISTDELIGNIIDALNVDVNFNFDEEPMVTVYGFKHGVHALFQYLSENCKDCETVLRLEWRWIGFLHNNTMDFVALPKEMLRDSGMFVELQRFCYETENEFAHNHIPADLDIEDAGYLLQRVDSVFELSFGDAIDGVALEKWVNTTRKSVANYSFVRNCDFRIGEILSCYLRADNTGCPALVVAEIIENLSSRSIDKGFKHGMMYGRTAWMYSRGTPEAIKLAEKRRANANTLRNRCPRVASILDGMAEYYETEVDYDDLFLE